MTFFLTGIETNNKGAELMLYSILQEIEQHYPNSIIYIEKHRIRQGVQYLRTNLKIILVENPLTDFLDKVHVNGLLKRLGLPEYRGISKVPYFDYLIDGSGLAFSDQMVDEYTYNYWKKILSVSKQYNAKIIFLPQGFGPIKKDSTKKVISLINEFANLICARDTISLNYLKGYLGSCFSAEKIKKFTDFTSLVKGYVPSEFTFLKNWVCIIPNSQMINKGIVQEEDYLNYLYMIVEVIRNNGNNVFFLNHQGEDDLLLLKKIYTKLGNRVYIVTDQNALITKGLISNSYMVITSRFHGLASSLNSGVPCLATTWSHKYKCLINEYNLDNCVLSIIEQDKDISLIKKLLDKKYNNEMRNKLKQEVSCIDLETLAMWKAVWNA